MNEFRCLKCGETFAVPDSVLREPGRLGVWHDNKEDGSECGGRGKLAAIWKTVEQAQVDFVKELFGRELLAERDRRRS